MAAAALAIYLAPVPAAAADACAGLDRYRPVATTELLTPNPTIHNNIPYATVRTMVGASQAVLLGVTQFAKEPLWRYEVDSIPAPDGRGLCLALRKVDISIRYNLLSISIASDVRPGSCTFEVTMEHERAHVAYEHGAARKALREIEKEIGRPRGHVHGDDEADARRKIDKLVERWAWKAYENADKVARRGHGYMDIQSNIRGSLARCPDWLFK